LNCRGFADCGKTSFNGIRPAAFSRVATNNRPMAHNQKQHPEYKLSLLLPVVHSLASSIRLLSCLSFPKSAFAFVGSCTSLLFSARPNALLRLARKHSAISVLTGKMAKKIPPPGGCDSPFVRHARLTLSSGGRNRAEPGGSSVCSMGSPPEICRDLELAL
jgi:hypothetical protein